MDTQKTPKAEANQRIVRLKRLDDIQFYELASKMSLQHIKTDYGIDSLMWRLQNNEEKLNLAQFYYWMSVMFGESNDAYDYSKNTFIFKFQMEVINNSTRQEYILNIVNMKSGVEFIYFRNPGNTNEKSSMAIHKPFNEELSKKDMDYIDHWFHYYLLTINYLAKPYNITPFYAEVDSALVIYGHLNGEFFSHHHVNFDTYEAELERLQGAIGTSASIEWEAPLVSDWLEIVIPEL